MLIVTNIFVYILLVRSCIHKILCFTILIYMNKNIYIEYCDPSLRTAFVSLFIHTFIQSNPVPKKKIEKNSVVSSVGRIYLISVSKSNNIPAVPRTAAAPAPLSKSEHFV